MSNPTPYPWLRWITLGLLLALPAPGFESHAFQRGEDALQDQPEQKGRSRGSIQEGETVPDRQEQELPEGAIRRLGSTRFRHCGWIEGLVFLPDGKRLISGGASHTSRDASILPIWDAATGERLGAIDAGDDVVGELLLSPDGKAVVTCGNGTIRSWDIETGRRVLDLEPDESYISDLACAPDGKTIVAGLWQTVLIVSTEDGKVLHKLVGFEEVRDIAFSPDGKVFATADADKTVRLWDIEKGESVARLVGHLKGVNSVAFSPDGRNLATGSDDASILIWDLAERTIEKDVEDPEGPIKVVTYSADGTRLAAVEEGTWVRLYDARTAEVLMKFPSLEQETHALCFSPDTGKIAWAGSSGAVHVGDLSAKPPRQEMGSRVGSVSVMTFSPDGKTLAAGNRNGAIHLWEVSTGGLSRELLGHEAGVRALCYVDGGRRMISGSWDNTICIWDLERGERTQTLAGHNSYVLSLALSRDEELLASGGYGEPARVWNLERGETIRTLGGDGYREGISDVAFSPSRDLLATMSFEGPDSALWDSKTWKRLVALPSSLDLAFHPDGKYLLLSGQQEGFVILEVTTGLTHEVLTTGGSFTQFRFSEDGSLMACLEWREGARLWNTRTWTEMARFSGHGGAVDSVAISPDGKLLATGGWDTTILIWNIEGELEKAKKTHGTEGRAPAAPLVNLEEAWEALAGADLLSAQRAMETLAAGGDEGIHLLESRLSPEGPAARETVRDLIRSLDAEDYADREAATRRLEEMGERIRDSLEEARAGGTTTPEMQARISSLLKALEPPFFLPKGELLRTVRSIHTLESMGTPSAIELLETLSKEAPWERARAEAGVALAEMSRKGERETQQDP